jgi:hypothetical protein
VVFGPVRGYVDDSTAGQYQHVAVVLGLSGKNAQYKSKVLKYEVVFNPTYLLVMAAGSPTYAVYGVFDLPITWS